MRKAKHGLRILLSCILLANAGLVDAGGSVLWEFWPTEQGCNHSSGGYNSDWIIDGVCMQGSDLQADDPLNTIGGGVDVAVRCSDPNGGSNRVASDDIATISWYNSTDRSCSGKVWLTINVLPNECGPYPANSLRVYCKRCKWFFQGASSPPYFLQAIGVLFFLTACIAFNLIFQHKLDYFAKVLPPKLCGCLFADEAEEKKNKKKRTRHRVAKDTIVELVENISMYTALDELETPSVKRPLSPLTNEEVPTTPLGNSLGGASVSKTHSGNLVSQTQSLPPKGRRQRRMSRFRDAQKFELQTVGVNLTPSARDSSSPRSPTSPLSAPKRRQSTKKISRASSPSVIPSTNPLLSTPLLIGSGKNGSIDDGMLTHSTPDIDSPHVGSSFQGWGWSKQSRRPSGRLQIQRAGSSRDIVEELYVVHAEANPEDDDATIDVLVNVYDEHGNSANADEDGSPFAPLYYVESTVVVEECKFCACPLGTHDCDEWMTRAIRGEFGKIARVDRATPTRTLVSFLKPRVELSKVPLPTESVDKAVWRELCTAKGFVVVREQGPHGERVIELEGNLHAWIDSSCVEWRSNCGSFVRVVEEPWKKAGTYWKDWYTDFELCVGEVVSFTKTPDGIVLTVTFVHSAQITLPVACFRPSTEEMYNSEALIIPQPMERRIMMAVFVASTPPLLSLKALFLVSMFGYAIFNVLDVGHSGRAGHHSSWEGYEEVYFKLFNSGYPSLMADCSTLTSYFLINFRPSRKSFIRGVGLPSVVVLVITTVISLPGILTHAIPMAVYYGWLWAPLFFIVYHATKIIIRNRPSPPVIDMDDAFSMSAIWKNHRGYVIKASTYYVFFRFAAECVGVIFLQTNYNYGVLTYDGTPYFQTIKTEFDQREFLCVWERGVQAFSVLWGG
eukprot:TRINITY_DN24815_c0_g1_i1.p1 TRINITY_DN24815_c0_g1~~TRINITY_DN24815_c0_g1_i1.p1  ORF type:complete len:899 (+),score=136.72 TRINITY_DN24815_c0_g1_i1:60-2756(+)